MTARMRNVLFPCGARPSRPQPPKGPSPFPSRPCTFLTPDNPAAKNPGSFPHDSTLCFPTAKRRFLPLQNRHSCRNVRRYSMHDASKARLSRHSVPRHPRPPCVAFRPPDAPLERRRRPFSRASTPDGQHGPGSTAGSAAGSTIARKTTHLYLRSSAPM